MNFREHRPNFGIFVAQYPGADACQVILFGEKIAIIEGPLVGVENPLYPLSIFGFRNRTV
jgi:hypothetical protein